MHTNKKYILFIATISVLLLFVSCQQQDIEVTVSNENIVPVSLTAYFIEEGTKVNYAETSNDLQPSWAVGDKIIGFDEATPTKNNYTFTVASLDDGVATLTGDAPLNCALHLIYLCDTLDTSIRNGSIAVSYEGQLGNSKMPAVMLADGAVTYGSGEFHFSNAGAVIGINAVKGVPVGSAISKITIKGQKLSSATIALNGGSLALTVNQNADNSISIANLTGLSVVADNNLSRQILIAVPSGGQVSEVSVETAEKPYSYTLASPVALAMSKYYYITDQTFIPGHEYIDLGLSVKWATTNIGAENPQDYGWYFSWGNVSGYIYNSSNWVSAQSGTVLSGGFTQANYSGTPGSSLTTNIPVGVTYDAARANWGSSWRMPTYAEMKELLDNCDYEWTTNYNGSGVTGVILTSKITGYEDQSIFMPAAGYGGKTLGGIPNSGYYWTSSAVDISAAKVYTASFLQAGSDIYDSTRYDGEVIRPVTE